MKPDYQTSEPASTTQFSPQQAILREAKDVKTDIHKSLVAYKWLVVSFATFIVMLVAVLIALAFIVVANQKKCNDFSTEQRQLITDALISPSGANNWQQLFTDGPQPSPRLAHGAFSINQSMYIHGGVFGTAGAVPLADMWAYDDNLHSWSQVIYPNGNTTAIPVPRLYQAMIDISTRYALMFGGYTGYVTDPNHHGLNDLWQFDTWSSQWTMIEPADGSPVPPARGAHEIVWANSALYVFGGSNKIPGPYYNDAWKFDWATRMWSNITKADASQMPAPRLGFNWVVVGSSAVLFGGACTLGFSATEKHGQCNDIWTYSWVSNVWTELHPQLSPPQRRAGNIDVSVFGIMYLYGGIYIENATYNVVYNDLWAFDLTQVRWMQLFPNFGRPPQPHPTFGHSVVQVGRNIVVFGGRIDSLTQDGTNQLWEYKSLLPV